MKRTLLIALLAAPLLWGGCSDKAGPAGESARKTITGVETATVLSRSMPEEIEAAGTIKASVIGTVSSKAMGTVTSIMVKEGQKVRKGQVLLTIDDSDVAQKAAAAEAGLKEAGYALESARKAAELSEATYKRYAKLFEANAISRQEFDNMTLQRDTAALNLAATEEAVRRARAGVEEVRVYRGYSRVAAPFDGIVAQKKIEAGSMASPGVPLVIIEDDSSFVLETSLDGRHAGHVRPGTKMTATISGVEYAATVTEVVPSVDAITRTFLVKASIKGEGLRTGLYAKVAVPGAAPRQALVVPASSIVEKGQLTGVYTVDGRNVISYTLVRTGQRKGGEVEVLSGLREGDRIISKGASSASDGALLGKAR